MIYSIILFFMMVSTAVLLFLFRKKHIKTNTGLLYKITGFVLFAVLFLKSSALDSFVYCINGGEIYGVEGTSPDIPEIIIRHILLWSECIIFSLLVSNNKITKWLLSRITLPLIILASFYFYFSVNRYLNGYEFGFVLMPRALAALLLVAEYSIIFFISLFIFLFDKEEIKEKKEIISLIKFGVISLLICIPILNFAAVFGETDTELTLLNTAHIGWIISIAVVLTLLIVLFKKEDQEIKFSLLAVIVYYLFSHYNVVYKLGLDTNRLPFQLCNIASYLFVIIILTRNKSLFNFIYIANPVGALVAIFTLSDRGNIFSFWIIHYMIEHLYVFIIPLLFISYGFFPRPKLKQLLKDYFIWFSIYFVFCLLFDCFTDGVLVKANPDSDIIVHVNFFYLLECPVKDVFPFYPALLHGKITLFGTEFYLLYILFIYVVFSVVSFILYFVMEGCYRLPELFSKKKKKNA